MGIGRSMAVVERSRKQEDVAMKAISRFVLLFLCIAANACARGPNVGSELPLKRVVIYRNGVGYFEREGEVDTAEVRFRVKPEMIGDFLASLAIVERGGSSVRSASFPLSREPADDDEPMSEPPHLGPPSLPVPTSAKGAEADDEVVVLHLDGEHHHLRIGYISETPVWRPSYRLVVQHDGKAVLQLWGIVQNLSGEDWNDISLTLVAGAPIAFQSTLADAVIPPRPIVTDEGEVIAAVPEAITTLSASQEMVEAEEVSSDGLTWTAPTSRTSSPRA